MGLEAAVADQLLGGRSRPVCMLARRKPARSSPIARAACTTIFSMMSDSWMFKVIVLPMGVLTKITKPGSCGEGGVIW